MSENDFQKELDKITKRAAQERKQELAQEKVRRREARRGARTESEIRPKLREQEGRQYTAVIIAELEYDDGADMPSKEQLAEDLGHTIMKWANQKGFYAIDPKEPVPRLVSVEVDIK